MDPNANLREQLELARDIADGDDLSHDEWDAKRDRLAELVLALDGWISNGGFLPTRWDVVKGGLRRRTED
jgi:hypothetical protein